jgi:hypothetical protein
VEKEKWENSRLDCDKNQNTTNTSGKNGEKLHLAKKVRILQSMGFITFIVVVNFISIMMTSSAITSQTSIFFPKTGWINFFRGNSMDVKQPNVPSELAFMMKSILCITMSSSYKHYALKIVII